MKGFFTRNVSLKLLSIFLAIILWYFVISEKAGETALSISPDFRNIPSSLIIFKNPVESINIRVTGPATLLRGLSPRDIQAVIDLSDAEPGVVTFGIQPKSIQVPRGLRVTMVSPASITLRFEKLMKKKLLVDAVLVGNPPEGYKVTGVWVEPASIEVVGAENESNEFSQWYPSLPLAVVDAMIRFLRKIRWKAPSNDENKDVSDILVANME